jgi:UDPglucose 6-dehydrogenase
VVGANDPQAADIAKAIHAGIEAPILTTDITSAELIKYASNAFLATKISFINEIASLCDIVGASIDDVSEGVAMDPRIGGASMRAGVGYGGSCFPKDVRALDYVALTNGHNFELLRSVITVNNRQRLLPVHALRERFGRLARMKVAVLGLSFKPGTGDMREAPSVDLIQALNEDNAEISTYDPVVNTPAQAGLNENVRVCSDLLEAIDGAQAVVIMTEWSEIVGTDWNVVSQSMEPPKFLFDGRNCLDRNKMISIGFEYQGVGRNGAHRRRGNRPVVVNQD